MPHPDGSVFEQLTIAGLVIQVNSSPELNFHKHKRFSPFRQSGSRHDILWDFQVARDDHPDPLALNPGQELAWFAEIRAETGCPLLRTPRVQASLERLRSRQEEVVIEAHPKAVAILDFWENYAEIHLARTQVAESKKRIVSAAFLAPFLPNFDALMLHASAIVRHGRAAVFLAPDEGGKTTAARLCPTGLILCDDQVIVRRRRGRFQVWGTPWGLHVDAKENAPLAGLFLLKKAKRFSLEPLPARKLVPFIWGEIGNSLSILPKPLKKKAFEIMCDIAAAAPTWTLSFAKDHIDWEQVDRALQSAVHG